MLILLLADIIIHTNTFREQPPAREGILKLSQWSFNDDGLVKLEGEWEFYRGKFLTPEDFKNSSPESGQSFISLPASWKGPERGYATYRLVIDGMDITQAALRVPPIPSATRIWANGELIYERGSVTTKRDEAVPDIKPDEVYLHLESKSLVLVIQQANYIHRFGGIEEPFLLGTHFQIKEYAAKKLAFYTFLAGSLLILGIYHMIVFLYRKKDKAVMFFGIFSVLVGLRTITSERMAGIFLRDISEYILLKADHLLLYYMFIAFVHFISCLLPEIGKTARRVFTVPMHLMALFVLFTPAGVYNRTIEIYYVLAAAGIVYLIYAVYRAAAVKRKGILRILIGIIPFILCAVHDLLLNSGTVILRFSMLPVAILFFTYSQSFIISNRYAHAYKKIERMSERLLVSDRIKDEFINSISDKVRRPVDGIIGILESVLEENGKMMKDLCRLNLSMAALSARRLKSIISDIVDFTRLKNNDLVLEKKSVDLWKTAEFAVELNRPAVAGRNIELINDIPHSIPGVWADEERLKQIINSLIDNAIKYTQQGIIAITAFEKDGITVGITDTGLGIPEDRLKHIFTYDSQKSDMHSFKKGSGFSLYITKKLIELHGGKIWVESQVNSGSRFVFTLPSGSRPFEIRKRCRKFVHSLMGSTNNIISYLKNSVNREAVNRILIAFSDIESLQIMTNCISNLEYGIETASDGEKVLYMLADQNNRDRFAMLILDTDLSKKTGFEVCRLVRMNYNLHEMPVLMLTSDKDSRTVSAVFNSGANDYLAKPFNREEFAARTKTLLALKRSAEMSVVNATKLESEKNRRLLVETLGDVAKTLSSTLDLHEVLKRLMLSMKNFVNFDFGLIILKKEEQYTVSSIIEKDRFRMTGDKEVRLSRSILLKKAEDSLKPMFLDDMKRIENDSVLLEWLPRTSKSILITPVVNISELLGLIVLCSYNDMEYDNEKTEIAYNFATQSGIAVKNARLFSEMQKLAITDDLTGLNNRRHFFCLAEKEFERYKRYHSRISVLMFDIDNFKLMNDTYGHQSGDEVLRVIARRCMNVIREIDIAGRYGGEEFAVLLVETGEFEARVVAERLRESIALRSIKVMKNKTLTVTVSIGVSTVDETTQSLDELLNNADKALYIAKRSGKNCVVSYKKQQKQFEI